MEWWRCREMVAFRYSLVALGMTETEPELGDSLLDQGAWTGTPGWTQPAPISVGLCDYRAHGWQHYC